MLRLFLSIISIICVAKCVHSANYSKCGKNEILSKCANRVCEYRNCSDVGQTIECEKVDRKNCIKGCICKNKYLRASNGTCIPANKCPPSCGENEIPTSCIEAKDQRRSCSELSEPFSCVEVDPQCCTDGCICKNGYLEDCDGKCIPMEQCPEAQCGNNEDFDLCPQECPEECGVDPSVMPCSPSPEPGSASCKPSCRCCAGYQRNADGDCIPTEECPMLCGENERPTTCIQSQCERRYCSDIPKTVSCVRVNPDSCTDGCLCVDGYLKLPNGTCIPADQCPEAQCCDNEEFKLCPQTCPGEECGVDPSLVLCEPSPEPGSPNCMPSCRCCDGYLRNDSGDCIPKEKCPPVIICGPNEEYNSCVNGGCARRNCSQPGVICVNLVEGSCIEGCQCKKGYLRADNNTCIPADKCPINCFGENEVAGCQSNCPPDTCDRIGKRYNCPKQNATEECIQECRCKKGYYRNAIGECISRADCLKCTGPNEYFSCGCACDNVCADLATQNQTNCPTDNIVCNPMCYCLAGYARDCYNTCIPISECPAPQPPIEEECPDDVECGPNAVYDSNCSESCSECPPQDCDICSRVLCEPIQDPPGCRCIDNYLRNRKGLCVPSEQCETISKRRPSKSIRG